VTKRSWYWIAAVAFAVHNVEEGIGAPQLIQLMQSRAPSFLRDVYGGMRAVDLRGSLVILSVIGLGLAAIAATRITSRPWSYVMLVFAAVMGLNGIAHVCFSIVWRGYMPGTLTALGLTIPVSLALLIRSDREVWIAPSLRWTLAPAAIVVHGPVLVALIPLFVRLARLLTRRD